MNKNVLIGVIAVVLIAGGGGAWYYLGGGQGSVLMPDPKPVVSQGVASEAKGTLTFANSQYIVIGDPKFATGLYIRNSYDSKVDVALKPLIGKQVEVYGSLASQYSGDMLLLWLNGRKIMEESEAINPQSSGNSGGGQTFADMYKTLSQTQKDCLVKVLGNAKVQEWINNPSSSPTQEEGAKASACFSNP